MRIRTLAALSLVAGACAVAATGFPRRIGLTASQADVWDVLGHVFEPEDESTIIDIEDEDHILMRVAPPASPEGAEASGTCVIALLQLSPSRTLLHIRERHEAQGHDRVLAWAGVAAESLSSLSMLRDLRDACVGGLVDA